MITMTSVYRWIFLCLCIGVFKTFSQTEAVSIGQNDNDSEGFISINLLSGRKGTPSQSFLMYKAEKILQSFLFTSIVIINIKFSL
jgi:hypothetical protein